MDFEIKRNLSLLAVAVLAVFLGLQSTTVYFYGLAAIFIIIFVYMGFKSTSTPDEDESFDTTLRLIMIFAGVYLVGGIIGLILR